MKVGKNLTAYLLFIVFSAVLAVLFGISPKSQAASELIIYDVHPESPRIVKDDGSIEFADYVRIRNMSDHPYDLTGLFLSDSSKDYAKLPLDGIVIEPGGSQMIRLDPSWNFALKASGDESVYLSDVAGNTIYRYTSKMKPKQPVLSAESGFYTDEFYLEMTARGNAVIHYTLDGSNPTEDSPVYNEPIRIYDRSNEPNTVVNVPNTVRRYLEKEVYDEYGNHSVIEQPKEDPVDKAFIIRAAAIDEYGNRSDTVTREYFFCGDKYENIISVVADREELFGPCGILVTGTEYDEWYLNGMEGDPPVTNFKKKGRDWEIAADMEYFLGGTKVFGQKCGLKLQGKSTRQRRIKNFQLRARNSYSGSDEFAYDFFENEEYRPDGIHLDDCFDESLLFDIVRDEKIIKSKTTGRVALFINGEFWNNVYIRQKIDEKYFEDHFGIMPDNLIVLAETFPETDYENEEEFDEIRGYYFAIYDFIEDHDLAVAENYEKIRSMMDVDSYIDYFAINTYIGSADWAEVQNDEYWRVKVPFDEGYGDGRFRWILHDADWIFNDSTKFEEGFITHFDLFDSLMENADFRQRFANRLEELHNTCFSEENILRHTRSGKWDEPGLEEAEQFLLGRFEALEPLINGIRSIK